MYVLTYNSTCISSIPTIRTSTHTLSPRPHTQEHARDSFENLLFSVCRFFELTGHAPESITMIGYEFKRNRFTELHRAALRYPAHSFQYIGTPALTPNAPEVCALCVGGWGWG